MQPRVIDGADWIATRIRFLDERLKNDRLSKEERLATEQEIDRLRKSPALNCTGVRPVGALPFRRRRHKK